MGTINNLLGATQSISVSFCTIYLFPLSDSCRILFHSNVWYGSFYLAPAVTYKQKSAALTMSCWRY